METFRELTRDFFALFLLLSCFIGCGQSLYWISKLSANQVKEPINRNYYSNEYYRTTEQVEDSMTIEDEDIFGDKPVMQERYPF